MTSNIIEALDDPSLFARHFRGGSWGPWRAFLMALFALPMDDEALALYRAHTGRNEPPASMSVGVRPTSPCSACG